MRAWCEESVGCLVSILLYHLWSFVLLMGVFNIDLP